MNSSSLQLDAVLAVRDTDAFATTLKRELEQLDHTALPLQQALAQSSYVSDSPRQVTILSTDTNNETIHSRVGVFFQGIIAGSCCADDPTPVDEQPEYCELDVAIDINTGEATITLISE